MPANRSRPLKLFAWRFIEHRSRPSCTSTSWPSAHPHAAGHLRRKPHHRRLPGPHDSRSRRCSAIAPTASSSCIFPFPIPQASTTAAPDNSPLPSSSYVDNLALADKCLAGIRQTLEQTGQWDSSTVVVMGDHSWRTKQFWKPPRCTGPRRTTSPATAASTILAPPTSSSSPAKPPRPHRHPLPHRPHPQALRRHHGPPDQHPRRPRRLGAHHPPAPTSSLPGHGACSSRCARRTACIDRSSLAHNPPYVSRTIRPSPPSPPPPHPPPSAPTPRPSTSATSSTPPARSRSTPPPPTSSPAASRPKPPASSKISKLSSPPPASTSPTSSKPPSSSKTWPTSPP